MALGQFAWLSVSELAEGPVPGVSAGHIGGNGYTVAHNGCIDSGSTAWSFARVSARHKRLTQQETLTLDVLYARCGRCGLDVLCAAGCVVVTAVAARGRLGFLTRCKRVMSDVERRP